jgi:putative Holliday junction resolvase
MRIMAVDYGSVRTGVAVSDISASIVGETFVIGEKNAAPLAKALVEEAEGRGVSVIVVGHPRNMDGTFGPMAQKCELLADALRPLATAAEIVLWDERLTTTEANRILSGLGQKQKDTRKKTVDAVAASLILEGYMRFRANSGG